MNKITNTPKITRSWYQSPNTRPKRFFAEFERLSDGSYRVLQANIVHRINQYQEVDMRVDARDFASDLANGFVYAK